MSLVGYFKSAIVYGESDGVNESDEMNKSGEVDA